MTNTAIITFGRMNPPTIGHAKLVDAVKWIASDFDADPLVYVSHSQDDTRNPLPYDIKIQYVMYAFGDVVQHTERLNIIDILKDLDGKYDHVVFVGDLERSTEFLDTLNKYNGVEYNFKTIDTISAGSRTDQSDPVDSMSATKMRSYAINNDIESFTAGLPEALRPIAANVFDDVRKRIKL